jgi:glycosyltransferase involved in cell wall biosynthesis
LIIRDEGVNDLKSFRRLRILRVVIGLNQGGVQQAVLNLFKGLDLGRFEPIACAIENSGAIGKEIEAAGFEVITLGYKRQSLATINALRQLMVKRCIDIVHASSYHPSFYARIAGVLADVPVLISHEHVVFDHQRFQRVLTNRLLESRTDAFISVGRMVADQVKKWYRYPAEKVKVIHNGVDLARFAPATDRSPLRATLDLPSDRNIVAMVARLDPEKGHQTLFEAIRILDDHSTIYLVIGTGRHEAEIRAEAVRLGVCSQVHFLGLRRDIPELLQAVDIFAFPTLQEGFSNALIEAMASGCAIVASDYPSNMEAVEHEISALISPRLDASALAVNLARLLHDSDLQKRLAMAARKRAEHEFSLEANAMKTATLYEELWQSRKKSKK